MVKAINPAEKIVEVKNLEDALQNPGIFNYNLIAQTVIATLCSSPDGWFCYEGLLLVTRQIADLVSLCYFFDDVDLVLCDKIEYEAVQLSQRLLIQEVVERILSGKTAISVGNHFLPFEDFLNNTLKWCNQATKDFVLEELLKAWFGKENLELFHKNGLNTPSKIFEYIKKEKGWAIEQMFSVLDGYNRSFIFLVPGVDIIDNTSGVIVITPYMDGDNTMIDTRYSGVYKGEVNLPILHKILKSLISLNPVEVQAEIPKWDTIVKPKAVKK